ncbi:hypothetical protein P3L10_034501 [Capsicum annuum]
MIFHLSVEGINRIGLRGFTRQIISRHGSVEIVSFLFIFGKRTLIFTTLLVGEQTQGCNLIHLYRSRYSPYLGSNMVT